MTSGMNTRVFHVGEMDCRVDWPSCCVGEMSWRVGRSACSVGVFPPGVGGLSELKRDDQKLGMFAILEA